MWSNRNSQFTASGDANGTATIKDNLAASYRIKYTTTKGSSNHDHWSYSNESTQKPTKTQESYTKKNLKKKLVYSSSIHNNQFLKTNNPSASGRMHKLLYIQTMEYLGLKRN